MISSWPAIPLNPARVLGHVHFSRPEDVDDAVSTQRHAFESWSKRPVAERAQILKQAADMMSRKKYELAH